MLNLKGVKARPHDLDAMVALNPSLVELHCSADDLNWTPTRAYDVPLVVHVPEYADGELLDPASLDEAKRRRAQALYALATEKAAAWARFFRGTPKVVFHPGGQSCEERPADDPLALLGALSRTVGAMQAAAGAGADVLIENLPKVCWFNGGSWKAQHMTSGFEVAGFCRAHGIGATLDLCHLHLTPHDVVGEIKDLRPFVRHVHYSDGFFRKAGREVYEEGLQVGEGDMPLARYLAELDGLHGEVFGVPEIWYGHERGGAAFVEAWKRVAAYAPAAAGAP